MESEKTRFYEGGKSRSTSLLMCMGVVCCLLVATICLSFYNLVSFQNYKQTMAILEQHGMTNVDVAKHGRSKRYYGHEQTSSSGAIYIHYGKLSCPGNASRVYGGEVATSYYNNTGGTNYLCIPSGGLEWLSYSTGTTLYESLIMGADYQTSVYGSNQLFANNNLDNKNVPCSLCQAESGNDHQVMIPGKTTCPDSTWTREYYGYLMTTNDALENQSEYICVDYFSDPYPANDGNDGAGAHMVHVKGYCAVGSGDIWGCQANENLREFTCVVCSR